MTGPVLVRIGAIEKKITNVAGQIKGLEHVLVAGVVVRKGVVMPLTAEGRHVRLTHLNNANKSVEELGHSLTVYRNLTTKP